jgi:protein phosphatase PTC7
MQLFGSLHYAESPADADVYSHPVSHGDVIILATDGVWDNLSPEDVLNVVCGIMVRFQAWVLDDGGNVAVGDSLTSIAEDCMASGSDAQKSKSNNKESSNSTLNPGRFGLSSILASTMVREAKAASVNMNRESPFGRSVKKEFPYEQWRGGKVDDICVVAGVVLENKS